MESNGSKLAIVAGGVVALLKAMPALVRALRVGKPADVEDELRMLEAELEAKSLELQACLDKDEL